MIDVIIFIRFLREARKFVVSDTVYSTWHR